MNPEWTPETTTTSFPSPREAPTHARHRWAPPLVALALLALVLVSLQPPPGGGAGAAPGSAGGQALLRADGTPSEGAENARPSREAGSPARADPEAGNPGGDPAEASLAAAAPAASSPDATLAPVANADSAGAVARRPTAPLPALGFATDLAAAARAPEPVRPPAPDSPLARAFAPGGGSGAPGLATFFGAPGHGSRFVYIIDKSGSMSGAPFETAKRELLRSLRALQPHEQFFVIFYDGQADPMPGERLVSATPGNIENAVDWVRSVSLGGSTNPTEALTLALEDLRPDTIWLLSDGAFGAGVVDVIATHNADRRTHINTLAFVNRSGEALLKVIASENRGDYRFVPGP